LIPLSVPTLDGNEWKYVKECLDTAWVSSAGKYVEQFEREFARLTGAKYAVACINGTAALQVALRLVGVASGDEVIVPTVTFIAPVNAARYLGANPVFMDCDSFYNIDSEKTIDFIRKRTQFRDGRSYNRTTGRRIAALVPVHVFGNAVRLDELLQVCRERRIAVVEDASESAGTRYTVGPQASKHTGTLGDVGCFSFNGNKIITTGGGGMIVTDDPELARKARYLTTQAKDDNQRFIHNDVGYNFRLTNVQAALGVAQLERLPRYLKVKRENYLAYAEALADFRGLSLAPVPDYADNNHWMYPVRVDASSYGKDREELMLWLADRGIETRPLWQLNHRQRPYADCEAYKIERANALYDETLNLPCSVGLTVEQRESVLSALK
jgi:aminotransferase in exopolysaccharide biosynthesis